MTAKATPVYKVGDPDPTTAVPEDEPGCRALRDGLECTWSAGHAGPHVAGGAATILGVWADGRVSA